MAKKCPECGSSHVAKIQYGMPLYSEKLQKQMDEGRIVLGGCCIGDDDPRWQCMDCGVRFGCESGRLIPREEYEFEPFKEGD